MGLCVFLCGAQIEAIGLQNKAFIGQFKRFDFIVLLGVQDVALVQRQVRPQMDVIGIGPQAFWPEGVDFDGAFFNLF